ncbi:hypothetical protein LCGC14_1787500 [marine sediment metagenome]|uniref:Uncharacterized protein n=1 Tax=marine sediment metagenome TaxID=412755 RepID=A0A0F9J8F6_9ZZZZ
MFGEINMITLNKISYFLKVFTISSAIMMVLEPTATLIITTFIGLILVGVLDLIDALRESIEWYEEKNNEN